MSLFSRSKPKIDRPANKPEGFTGWLKCQHCGELNHQTELATHLQCCPHCDHHRPLTAKQRIELLADPETFEAQFEDLVPLDRLGFCDKESYSDRLARAATASGLNEALLLGTCRIEGNQAVLGAMDFFFMGGSMGSVVGEVIARGIELAIKRAIPLVLVSNSGGARMQESTFSLMQMAKTSAELARLERARLPYISILANPTAGGVTASFGSLGDIIIAEPGALICFAGPRVVERAMNQKLPRGAQRAETLLKCGMIDGIAHRKDLKATIAKFLDYLG